MGVVANLVIKITASLSDFEKQMAGLEKTLGRTGAKMQSIGGDLTKGLTLPIVAIGGASIKAAMDFETSFSGIRKTVKATEAEYASMAAQMRELAKTKPVDVNVLNKIGEQAGHLSHRGSDGRDESDRRRSRQQHGAHRERDADAAVEHRSHGVGGGGLGQFRRGH